MNNTMLSQEQKLIVENAFNKNPELAMKVCNLSEEEADIINELLQVKKILGKQYLPSDKEIDIISFLLKQNLGFEYLWCAIDVYNYGRIQGMKFERARRKARAC